jgi:FKBP-type peptidyl-prolyl cis-trans isomerase FkpA
MCKKIVFSLFILLLLGCEDRTPEFYYTQNDLKYQYHDIVAEGTVPKIGDYLTVYLQYKTLEDSIFYDSQTTSYDGTNLIILGKPSVKGGIEEGFAQLIEGDSVSFYIASQLFFENYLNKELPVFLEPEEEIKIVLRLLKVETPKAYKKRKDNEIAKLEAIEFDVMQEIIDSWKANNEEVKNVNGIFMTIPDTTCTKRVRRGEMVKVKYKGYYPNGKVFYDNTEAEDPEDEFKVGTIGQNIEGMKIVLLKMCYGQKAKVLIPSFLGFSDGVVSQGLVPPYTPLIFEIESISE